MFSELSTILALLARNNDREPSWKRLIFPIVIAIMWAIGSIFKSKAKPPQPSSKPKTTPAQRPGTLPPYARRTRPSQQTKTQPTPPQHTQPAQPRPKPGVQRPTQPQPQPVHRTAAQAHRQVLAAALSEPQTVSRIAQPTQRTRPTSPIETTASLAAQEKKRRLAAAKAAKLRRKTPPPAAQQHPRPATSQPSADRLGIAANLPNEWARAIVYMEILGKPIGLRPPGQLYP